MPLEEIDIDFATIFLEDIWGMDDLFGKEHHDDPAEGFVLEIENGEPEYIRMNFTREGDKRDIMIEQQGDEIILYLYPNQPEVEERILLSRNEVVTEPESHAHKGP